MKLLCVLPEYVPHAGGGMLRYCRTLWPELARLGHETRVVVAAPFSPAVPTYGHDGVVVECVTRERIEPPARRFWHAGARVVRRVSGGVAAVAAVLGAADLSRGMR